MEAVTVESAADVAAAVDFAREHTFSMRSRAWSAPTEGTPTQPRQFALTSALRVKC